MKRPRLIMPLLLLALTAPIGLAQQNTANTPAETPSTGTDTTLKVQVVLAEYNGTQKLSSLPYTVYMVDYGPRSNRGSIRSGTKVPIHQGSFTTVNGTNSPVDQIVYQDIGTNIDCRLVSPTGMDGRYHLTFTIDRSSVVSATEANIKQGDATPTGDPIIRSFDDSFDVVLRDGQTIEGSSSVDPVTGNVMKVDVTLNVEK